MHRERERERERESTVFSTCAIPITCNSLNIGMQAISPDASLQRRRATPDRCKRCIASPICYQSLDSGKQKKLRRISIMQCRTLAPSRQDIRVREQHRDGAGSAAGSRLEYQIDLPPTDARTEPGKATAE